MEDSDIRDYFDALLKQYGSVDIADDEFKKQIHEDKNLREKYKHYCHEVGSTEKNGFLDYCEEFLDSQDTIWDNLKDAYEDD